MIHYNRNFLAVILVGRHLRTDTCGQTFADGHLRTDTFGRTFADGHLQTDICLPELPRENAFPTHFAKPRGPGPGHNVYSLIQGQRGELLADYVLFEDSMQKTKVPWLCYNKMTSEERTIYVTHLKAVFHRKLMYKCPLTGHMVKTASQLLYEGKCCGLGCRHCIYHLEGCNEDIKKRLVWNGAYYM